MELTNLNRKSWACFITYVLSTLLVLAFLIPRGAHALASGVTYQGRILKPDGTPLLGSTVQFKIQIRSPDANNCLMYEENQTLDMRNSNGIFALTINDGSGSRTDTTLLNLDRIFANAGTMVFGSSNCMTGSSYIPNSGDGRNLVVQFKDETMSAYEPMPSQRINFVPFAFESKQLQGFAVDSLLHVVDVSGNPVTGLSPMSNANYTELLAIIGGTSAQYTKANGTGFTPTAAVSFNSQRITNLSGPTSGTDAANKTYVDSYLGGSSVNSAVLSALAAGDTGKVLQWNGTTWTAASNPAGQWTTYGSAIGYSLGNVGIGTTSPDANLSINANTVTGPAAPSATLLHLTGADSNDATMTIDSFTNLSNSPSLTMRGAAGTAASPSALGPNKQLGTIGFRGYGATGYSSSSRTAMKAWTSETWTDTAQGAYLTFTTTPSGTAAATERMRIDSSGVVGIGTTVPTSGYLDVEQVMANGASPTAAGFFSQMQTVTANGAYQARGLNIQPRASVASGITSTSGLIGESVWAYRNFGTTADNGTMSTEAGIVLSYGHYNSDVTAAPLTSGDSYGISVQPSIRTGTIGGNMYDLYLYPSLPGGTLSGSHFGLYQADTSAKNYFAGSVGIGTTSPSVKLQVAGSVLLGNGAETCAGGNFVGALRYNVGTTSVEFCNGTGWLVMSSGASSTSINAATITNASGGITLTPQATTGVVINSTVASTSPTTGALTVNGGIGASGAIYSSGLINSGSSITAATDITAGNNLYVLGKVGIGTTSPSSRLTVDSGSSGYPGIISLTGLGTGTASIGSAGAFLSPSSLGDFGVGTSPGQKLVLGTGGVTRMTLDTAGYVGIGTTSPTRSLSVYSSGDSVVGQYEAGGGALLDLRTDSGANGAAVRFVGAGLSGTGWTIGADPSITGSPFVVASGANYVGAMAANTKMLVVNSAGNVGIGTTSPSGPLTINAAGPYTVNLQDAGADRLKFQLNASTQQIAAYNVLRISGANSVINQSYGGSGQTWIKSLGIGSTNFETGSIPTNGMYVEGNVGIGTTSASATLDVVGVTKVTGTLLNGITGWFRGVANGDANVVIQSNAGGSTAYWMTAINGGGQLQIGGVGGSQPNAGAINIVTGGNVGIGTTLPVYRLQVDENKTDPTGTVTSVRGRAYPTFTANNSNVAYGNYSSVSPLLSTGVTASGTQAAIYSDATVNLAGNAGTVGLLAGLRTGFGIATTGGGSVTAAVGVDVQPYQQAGSIVDSYGVRILAPYTGTGTVTNEYGIYQASATAKNYFAGNVGIGTSAPAATLDINGTAKLKINSSAPAACTTTNSGTVAVNSAFRFCICKGPTTTWVYTTDGTTTCVW